MLSALFWGLGGGLVLLAGLACSRFLLLFAGGVWELAFVQVY
jgi:hypothetical protein